ncbi:hypothetical protein SK128_004375, partial [Halocaridina rubra]
MILILNCSKIKRIIVHSIASGNLTGCLLAPQEMDYLRKEIVSSLRSELREMLRDALARALNPTTTLASHYYSPTPTPNPSPQYPTTPISQSPQMPAQQFSSSSSPQARKSSASSLCTQNVAYQASSGPYFQTSPTSEISIPSYLRVSGSHYDQLDPRSSPSSQSSPKASPINQASQRSTPSPQLYQRPGSSCGISPRALGSNQMSPSNASQVLLRPP